MQINIFGQTSNLLKASMQALRHRVSIQNLIDITIETGKMLFFSFPVSNMTVIVRIMIVNRIIALVRFCLISTAALFKL